MSDVNRPYEQVVNHIKCKAEDCRWHDSNDCCTAHCIEVTACGECSCDDPACATYEQKF